MATVKQTSRRERVLESLQKQLVDKTKTEKKTGDKVELTEKDTERIKSEIDILKSRI